MSAPVQATKAGQGITRRNLLQLLGMAGTMPVVASMLQACGGSPPATATTAATAAPLVNTPVTGSGTPLTTFATMAPATAAAGTGGGSPAAASPVARAGSPAAAPSGQGTGQGVRGGTLHLATSADPDRLDPARTIQANASSFNDHIYDRLVYIDRDRLPKPWLAERWDISPDGKQITFVIRKGIKFHDGTDLNGAAVKFTFDRILDPATASPAKAQMGTLQSVDLVDDFTVRFNFSDPYAPFFTNISLSYGGIVSPAAVQKFGDNFSRNPTGAGPFKFKEWVAGQRIVFERNPDYKNFRTDGPNTGAAYLDQIEWRIIADAPTRLAALQSGELDVSDVDVQQVGRIREDPKYQIIIWKEATNHNFIEYANKEPFTDLAVRQAIAHSIDRDSIVKSAWNGYATPNLNPMPVGVAGHDPAIGQQYGYPFDLTKARKVLTDAGYAPDPSGVMAKGGRTLAATLMLYSNSNPAKTACEIIQATLQQIGIKSTLQILEFGTMQPLLREGKQDFNYMRWTWPDPVIESPLFKSPGWTNQLSDPELDKLLTVADTTLDPSKRIGAVHEVQKYVLQKAYIAPIATDWIVVAARANVKDYL
jgi:peptide/nickel transport system substrate-binding protein